MKKTIREFQQNNELYEFTQNESTVTLNFTVPKLSTPVIVINQKENSIFVGVFDKYLICCGELYDCFRDYEETIVDNEYKITFFKNSSEIWPIFIKKQSKRGIDGKSAYDLYEFHKDKNLSTSKIFLGLSKSRNYYKSYLDDLKKAKKEKDILNILLKIDILEIPPKVMIYIAKKLIKDKKYVEAISSLNNYIKYREEELVMLKLIDIISPLRLGKYQDEGKCKIILEKLNEMGSEKGKEMLALHYYNGVYYKKDKNKALEIYPKLNTTIVQEKLKESSIVIGVSALLIGTSLFIYKKLGKK